jgi:hypothetical protein
MLHLTAISRLMKEVKLIGWAGMMAQGPCLPVSPELMSMLRFMYGPMLKSIFKKQMK